MANISIRLKTEHKEKIAKFLDYHNSKLSQIKQSKNQMYSFNDITPDEQEIDDFMRLVKTGKCCEAYMEIMKNPSLLNS